MMFSITLFAAAAAAISMISLVTATYDLNSQANLALYYGQGPNQQPLAHFCNSSSVDIIPIGFVNIFPSLANGLVAENFGNQCWNGNYTGPGYNGVNNPANNFLYRQCPQLQEDIYYCQTQTKKKILLSLGGEGGNYQLNGKADGEYLADFLWGAYGPYNASWVAAGGVRPLDRGYNNADPSKTIDIDGFDFDIERQSTDSQVGYIAAINRLRVRFAQYKQLNSCSKTYLISGAPQCPLPEQNMGLTITNAKFDILFIQFYNNGANGCTARNYSSSTNKATSGFNYNKWVTFVNSGASAGAKLYIGLLGSNYAGTASDYILASEAKPLIAAYHGATQFGGVMLWEATYAENNNAVTGYPGMNYYQIIKSFLAPYAPTVTSTTAICATTTSRSVSSSKTSTTSSKLTTTKATTASSTSSPTKPATSSCTGLALATPKPSTALCGIKANFIAKAGSGALTSYSTGPYVASYQACAAQCIATSTCTNVYFVQGSTCNLKYGPVSYVVNTSGVNAYSLYTTDCFQCATCPNAVLASPAPAGSLCNVAGNSIPAAGTGTLVAYGAGSPYAANIRACGSVCFATAGCTNVYFVAGTNCNLHYGPTTYTPNTSGVNVFYIYDASCFTCVY
ncbi:hypothetical protein LZ554_005783 [Drepanopeziza brunnea f. sp. 'monogermtubi']|nr:hypothetical protein LZ554_005783 [Drepanopeziza brunnea f. sp. 'monogermtubi']